MKHPLFGFFRLEDGLSRLYPGRLLRMPLYGFVKG
jgi:hypothetical protein